MRFVFLIRLLFITFAFFSFNAFFSANLYSYEPPPEPERQCVNPTFSGIFTHPDCVGGTSGVVGATVRVENQQDPTIKGSTQTSNTGEFSLGVSCNSGEIQNPSDDLYRQWRLYVDYIDKGGNSCGGALSDLVTFSAGDTTREKRYDQNISKCSSAPQLICSGSEGTPANECANVIFQGLVKSKYYPSGVPYSKVTFINPDDASIGGYYITGTDGTYNLSVSPHQKEITSERDIYRTFNFFSEYTYNDGTKCNSSQRSVVVVRPYQQCIYEAVVDVGDIDMGECGPKSAGDLPVTPPTPGPSPIGPPPPTLPRTGELVCKDALSGLGAPPWWHSEWNNSTFRENLTKTLKDLGVKYIRFSPDWGTIEREENKFNYNDLQPWGLSHGQDIIVDTIYNAGVEPVGLFVASPYWISLNQAECRSCPLSCGIARGNEDKFRNSVRNIVGHYFPKVKKWEFWNEAQHYGGCGATPPSNLQGVEEYAYWEGIFYDTVKQVNNSIQVAATTDDYEWILPQIDNLKYDAIVVHPYSDSDPFVDTEEVLTIASAIPEGKKIWITEYGWDMNNISEDEQASRLQKARSWLNTAPKVDIGLFHLLADDGPTKYGLILGDFYQTLGVGTKRKSYEIFKSKKCTYSTVAGTCEQPLKYFSKPSCETLSVSSPAKMVSFSIVPGKDKEEDDPGDPNPLARIWKRTFKVKFEKDWSTDQSKYRLDPSHSVYYLFDNDPKKFVIRQFTGVPASGNEKLVTAVQLGDSNSNDWGLFNYFLSPTFTTPYIEGKFRDLAKSESGYLDRASAVMLSKGNIKLISGDKDGVSVVPETQSQLGGARLEKKQLALNLFGTQKVVCSVAGRPGDTNCGATSGIPNFDLFAQNISETYGNYAGEQLAVTDSSNANGLSCSIGSNSDNGKDSSKLLAANINSDYFSLNDSASENSEREQVSGNRDSQGQVLAIDATPAPCYSLKTTSEKLECPYKGKVYPTKDTLDIVGKTVKEMDCVETNRGIAGSLWGGYPSQPGCTYNAKINIQHNTIYGFESPAMDLQTAFARSIAFNPSLTERFNYSGEYSGVGERQHNEVRASTDITVSSSEKAYVLKGTQLSCEFQTLASSINNSPSHSYPQPDPSCFKPTSLTPPDLSSACRKVGKWTNSNTVSWEERAKPDDPSFGVATADLAQLVIVIVAMDPESFSAPGNACTGCNYDLYGPGAGIQITYNGVTKAFTFNGENGFHTIVANLEIPKTARYEAFSGSKSNIGEDTPCYTYTTLLGGRDPTVDKCVQAYVYPVIHGSSNDEEQRKENKLCGVTNTCVAPGGRPCSEIPDNKKGLAGCGPTDEQSSLNKSGFYWAIRYNRPLDAFGCSYKFGDEVVPPTR